MQFSWYTASIAASKPIRFVCARVRVADISWLTAGLRCYLVSLLWWMFSHGHYSAVESLSHFMLTPSRLSKCLFPKMPWPQSSTLFSFWPLVEQPNKQAISQGPSTCVIMIASGHFSFHTDEMTRYAAQSYSYWMVSPHNVSQCQSWEDCSARQSNFCLHLHAQLTHPWPQLSLFPSLSASHKGVSLLVIGVSWGNQSGE